MKASDPAISAVRALMADYVPRTPDEVAASLGIDVVTASRALSAIKRADYGVIIIERRGVPGQGNGSGPAIWQRRMFQTEKERAA